MEIHKVQINELISPDYNPRTITDEELSKLKDSLEEFGYISPIIVNQHNNHIVGGNQRYECLKALGYDEIDVIYINEPDLQREKALNIRLNNLSGEWDKGKLETIFNEFEDTGFNTELTGFNTDNLQGFHDTTEDDDFEVIEDDYQEYDDLEVTVSKGDIYILGNHRLMCGDATNNSDLKKLITKNNTTDPVSIDCYITDPPYGVDYNNKNEFLNKMGKGNHVQKEIVNDATDDYETFFTNVLNNVVSVLSDYNLFYIFMLGKELHKLRLALDNAKCVWGNYLVWVKNNHVLGRKDYNSKHEFCVYGWHNHHKFYGGFQTTILEFDKPVKSELHPTMKPIPLISKLIQDGTLENMNVLDTFGGSGTTLMACEQTNRNCYMMELDPYYCQVIINRWEEFTGKQAVKIN